MFEVPFKSVTKQVLKVIQDVIDSTRIEITEEEVVVLWPKIKEFKRLNGVAPDMRAKDPAERRMAEAVLFVQKERLAQSL